MTQQEALEILLYHQRWRLGEDIPMKYGPLEITAALDVAIETLKSVQCPHDEQEAVCDNGNGTTLSEYKARCRKCGHMP